jgi:hypothetical protein
MRDAYGVEIKVGDTVNAYDARTGHLFENGTVEVINGNKADVSDKDYNIITVGSSDIILKN